MEECPQLYEISLLPQQRSIEHSSARNANGNGDGDEEEGWTNLNIFTADFNRWYKYELHGQLTHLREIRG